MTLSFLPSARDEVISAAAYYEEREKGLGGRFRDEVSQACRRILQDPYLLIERPWRLSQSESSSLSLLRGLLHPR